MGACPGAGTGGDPIVCDLGTVVDQATPSVTIIVTVDADTAAGNITNTGEVKSADDTMTGNNTNTADVTVEVEVDLSITKTDNITTVVAGDQLTYEIVVSNGGPSDAVGATVTDNFPAELTNITWTCAPAGAGSSCTNAMGAGNLSESVNVGAGGTVTFSVTATVDPGATGTISNTASVAPPAGSTDTPGDKTATDNDTVITIGGDLSITKSDDLDPVDDAATLTYTVTVLNAGPSHAVGVVVMDTFPTEFETPTWTCLANGAGSSCANANGNGNLNETVDVGAGGNVVFTVMGTINAGLATSITNTASLTVPGGFNDTNGTNHLPMETTTITPRADLVLTKMLNGGTPLFSGDLIAGKTVIYDLKVTNNGPNDATGVQVVDTFPALLSHNTNNCSAIAGATTVTWDIPGTIAKDAMETCSITFNIDPTANSPINNSATVTASTMLIDTGDDTDSEMTGVAPATLSISSGDNQQTPINTAFADPLVALVESADSMPIAGAMVTFTPPGAGASAVITGSPATTTGAGFATVTATANTTVGGPYNVGAGVSGAAHLMINFSLQNLMNPPVAMNDSYQTAGNTLLEVAATTSFPNTAKILFNDNLCANDTDPSALGKTVAQVQGTVDGSDDDSTVNGVIVVATMNLGTVAVTTATCEFNYKPPVDSGAAGNSAATTSDMFTYDLNFGVAPATVSIVFKNQIWYVDNTNPSLMDDGTSTNPFNTLAEASAASGTLDTIFVYTGDGMTTGQDSGITLLEAQRLIGQGVALTIPDDVTQQMPPPIAGPQTLLAAGTQPKISGASPGVTVLNVSAVISGLDITSGTNDSGVSVSCNMNDIRTVEISTNTIAADLRGIHVMNGGCTYELDISNNHITDTGAGVTNPGIFVAGAGAGQPTFITNFDSNTVDGSVAGVLGTGIHITAATFDANRTLPNFQPVTGGTTTIGVSTSNRVGENGLVLGGAGAGNAVSGILVFTDLDIFATDTGLAVIGSGPLAAGTGFGLTAPAGSSVDASGAALDMDPMTATMNLTANGTVVSLTDVSGAVNITGGTLIGGATPTVEISGGAGDIDIGASVIADNALAVSISGLLTTADIDFNSTVVSNGAGGGGISVTNGAGTNSVTFNGDVDLGQTIALNAIGLTMTGNSGGTTVAFGDLDITTSGFDGIVGTTDGKLTTGAGSTVDTTNGTAINITGLDFGGASLNFSNVDQTGTGNGINLAMITGTVNLGTVTINATGTGLFASTAGTATVNSTSGAIAAGNVGISASGPTMTLGLMLTSVGVTGGTHGIFLDDTAGSLMVGAGSTITGTSTAGVEIDGSTGTAWIGSNISTSSGRPVIVENLAAATADIDFNGTVTASAGSGILIQDNNLAGATIDFIAQTTLNTVANDGVELINNDTATITFSGGLDITTTSGRGIDATAGAAGINVMGAGNTVTTTTGTAVNIVDSTIGGSNVTFQSIDSTTASSNTVIILDDTGSGQFMVTGTGTTDGSGGTIDNKTADAVTLNNTDGLVTFKNMIIEDIGTTAGGFQTRSGHDAIHGQTVDGGLTLDNTTIRRISDMCVNGALFSDGISATVWNGLAILNGSLIEDCNRFHVAAVADDSDEGGVRIVGLKGTATITDSTFRRTAEHLDIFTDTSGTLNMTVQNNAFEFAYKEFGSGGTPSVGQMCLDVTAVGAGNANVTVGDETTPALGNTFLNCKLASVRIANATGATGDIDAIVARNTFETNDFSSGIGGDIDFPMSGVKYSTRGADSATFDGIVSFNVFTRVANADGGTGQLTLDMEDGDSQIRVDNNTFDRPFNAPWFVRADSSQSAAILFQNNTYIAGQYPCTDPSCDDGVPPPGFPGPGLKSDVVAQNAAIIDIRIDQEDFAPHDTVFDPGNTVEAKVLNVGGGSTMCIHLTNNTSPDGYALEQFAGTLNLQRGVSGETGGCTGGAPANCITVVDDNGNTGGNGNSATDPPDVDVIGTVNNVVTACDQPTGGIF